MSERWQEGSEVKLVSAIATAASAIVFRLMMYETNLTELSGWSSFPPYLLPRLLDHYTC